MNEDRLQKARESLGVAYMHSHGSDEDSLTDAIIHTLLAITNLRRADDTGVCLARANERIEQARAAVKP